MKSLSPILLIVLPLSVLVPWAPFLGPINTNDIVPIIGGLGGLGLLAQGYRGPAIRGVGWLALVLFGLAMLVSHFLTTHGGLSLSVAGRTLGRMLLYAIIGAAIQGCLNEKSLEKLGVVFIGVVLFEAVMGLGAALTGYSGPLGVGVVDYPAGHFPADGWARAQGTFGGALPPGEIFVNRANFYSAYLVIGLFVVLERYQNKMRQLLFFVPLILAGIIASGSRMSLLAGFAGLVIFMALTGNKRVLGIGLAASMCTIFAYEPLRSRFLNMGTDRFELWSQALDVIKTSPWLGVGDGRYLEVARQLSLAPGEVIHSPHHSILYAAASYGIFVALGLVALYGGLLWQTFSERQKQPALFAMVVAFILHDMTNNLFFIPEVALSFWVALAYLKSKSRLVHD